jgi:hypothetical protein
MSAWRSFLLSLVAVGVVSGCGGTTTTVRKPTQTTQASTITLPAASASARAQYVARADRICFSYRGRAAHFQDRLSELADTPASTENEQKAAEVMRNVAQLLSEVLHKLSRLSPPPGDEPAIRAYFNATRDEIDLVKEQASALEELDASRAQFLNARLRTAIDKVKQIARGYGFRVCGAA